MSLEKQPQSFEDVWIVVAFLCPEKNFTSSFFLLLSVYVYNSHKFLHFQGPTVWF